MKQFDCEEMSVFFFLNPASQSCGIDLHLENLQITSWYNKNPPALWVQRSTDTV